jgi:CHAD domain-containing protein
MARSKLAKICEFRKPPPELGVPDREAESRKPPRRCPAVATSRKHADEPADLRGHVVAFAFKHLDRFASLELKVLRGEDAEAIHDIRVATRRLQTAIDLVFPKPRSAEVRKLRRRLKRCRRVLSEVRNCDVMQRRVDTALARKRTARREAWTAFRQFLEKRRSQSFSKAARKLGKANLTTLYLQLKRLLERASGQPPDEGLRENQFRAKVAGRLEDARGIFRKRLDACLATPDAQASHKLRIAAKRLRYLIEVLRESDIRGSSDALIWFRRLQTHLGDLHDTDVLEQMMIEMIARPEFLRDHLDLSFEAARLIAKIRRRKQALAQSFVGITSDSAKYRRIQDWLAVLPESLSAAAAIP